jgi:hypothetical protein
MNQKIAHGTFEMLFLLILSILSTPIYAYEIYEIPVVDTTTTFDLSGNQRLRSNKFLRTQTFKADMPFTAVGVHWAGEQPYGSYHLIEVRTSKDGEQWTDWLTVDIDATPEENPKGEFFSSLITVAGEERTHEYVDFRIALIANDQGKNPTLDNLSFTFFDGGITPSRQLESIRRNQGNLRRGGVSKPHVVSRSGWGANESIMRWTPRYRSVTHLIIHHTAGANSARNGDWPSVVRGIYQYHAVTRGWGDIGYHYLVDPNGVLYEGRSGGDNVIGAHAYRYNSGTMAISFMGNFETANPASNALRSAEKLLAWKSSQRDIKPLESGKHYTGKTVKYIAGHRDWASTACPGRNLYSQLPTIRKNVSDLMGGIGGLEVYDFWRLADPIYADPNSDSVNHNFDAQFKIKNNGSGPVNIDRLALAVHYSDGRYFFDLNWEKTDNSKFINNLRLKTGGSYWFTYATGFIREAGTYKLIAKSFMDNKWHHLAEQEFTVKPPIANPSSGYSWTGNGSIISYHGLNRDIDTNGDHPFGVKWDKTVLQPNLKQPVGFFQWQADKQRCNRLKIRTDSATARQATISIGSWSRRDNDRVFENVMLPFVVGENNTGLNFENDAGNWYVLSVAFKQPVREKTDLFAECTSHSTGKWYDKEGYHPVRLEGGYVWNGAASVLSHRFRNQSRNDSGDQWPFGAFEDVTKVHRSSEKPLVVFQWHIDSQCQRLEFSTDSPKRVTLSTKPWSSSQKSSSNVTLPITLSASSLGLSSGNWAVVEIAFANPVSKSFNVRGVCK